MYNGFYFKPLSSSFKLICILRLSMLRIAELELAVAPALPLQAFGLLFLFFAIKHLPIRCIAYSAYYYTDKITLPIKLSINHVQLLRC